MKLTHCIFFKINYQINLTLTSSPKGVDSINRRRLTACSRGQDRVKNSMLVDHIIMCVCVYHLFVRNNVGTIEYRGIDKNKNKLSD